MVVTGPTPGPGCPWVGAMYLLDPGTLPLSAAGREPNLRLSGHTETLSEEG